MSTNWLCASTTNSARCMADMTRRGLRGFLVEGAQAGDLLSQYQGVDVVRPLVGVHRFEVCEVSHRLILGQDAVRAEEAARLPGDIGRHVDVVALGEAHLLGRGFAVVLEAAELETEQLCF